MARTRRRKATALNARLESEAWRFDFFQAVRLLERMGRRPVERQSNAPRQPVGYDSPPDKEAVRFRALPARSFPAGPVGDVRISPTSKGRGAKNDAPPEMLVAFMGLTGPSGVLPERYLDLLLRRVRERDFALRDFLDIFNHRSISLFYRAWEKYRFPITYERARLDGAQRDLFSWCLRALVGTGTGHLQNRLGVDDEVLLYYGGHFAKQLRPAVVLEDILSDYFGITVRVEQFRGAWLNLDRDERTRLPSRSSPKGRHCILGMDALLGERVWDVQGSFRLRLGPLSYAQFSKLLPTEPGLASMVSVTRTFVGPELNFEIRLVLSASEVPACRLTRSKEFTPRLGWNTWLHTRRAIRNVDDSHFNLQETCVSVGA